MTLEARLNALRAKPEHVRRKFAFWSSFGFTAIVFAFWLASFTSLGLSTKGAVAQAVSKADTPAQSLIAGVGGFFYDIKDIVFGPRKVTFSAIEVRPGSK